MFRTAVVVMVALLLLAAPGNAAGRAAQATAAVRVVAGELQAPRAVLSGDQRTASVTVINAGHATPWFLTVQSASDHAVRTATVRGAGRFVVPCETRPGAVTITLVYAP